MPLPARNLESAGRERGDEALDVVGAARLESQVDLGVAHRPRQESAIVMHFQDVGPLDGDNLQDARQHSRPVRNAHREHDAAPLLDQAALDDAGEQIDVDVSS